MTVRHFSGGDNIIWRPGGRMSVFDGGPGTIAICYRSHNPAAAQGLIRMNNAAGNIVYSVNPFSDGNIYAAYGTAGPGVHTYADETWNVSAFTKANGLALARGHRLVLSTGVWTHVNYATLNDSPNVPDHMWIGKFLAGGEFLDGDIAGIAFYDYVMSDAAMEQCLTPGFGKWLGASPISFIDFTRPVADGLSDAMFDGGFQTAITGTTAVAGQDPPNFNLSLYDIHLDDDIAPKLAARYTDSETAHSALMQRYRAGLTSIRFDGTGAAYISTTAATHAYSTDRLFVAADITADDWTPQATQSVFAKYEPLFNLKSWLLQIRADGALEALYSPNGSTDRTFVSTAATGFTNGTRHAIGVDIDTTSAGNRTATFYTATSIAAADWVQLGAVVSQAGEESIFAAGATTTFGGRGNVGNTGSFMGNGHAIQVKNGGFGGTILIDQRFDEAQVLGKGGGDTFPDAINQAITWQFGRATAPVNWSQSGARQVYTAGHQPVLNILGDMDIRVKFSMTDWTPASTHWVINHGNSSDTPGNLKWVFSIHPNNQIRCFFSTDGTLTGIGPESVGLTCVDGSTHFLRCTFDADDGGGNSVVSYFESFDNGATWTPIGSPIVDAAGPITLFSSPPWPTHSLEIGRLNPGVQTLFYSEVRNGINGTIVHQNDWTKVPLGSYGYVDDTGLKWHAWTGGPRTEQVSDRETWDKLVAHYSGASAENSFIDDQKAHWRAFVP